MKKNKRLRIMEAPSEQGGVPLEESDEGKHRAGVVDALKLGLGIVLVLGTSLSVAWGAYTFALSTSRFAVQKIDVQGISRHTETTIARLGNLKAGENIFAVDVSAAEQALLADPWIYEARITRNLPGVLRVEVSEHAAVATAAVGSTLYLINRNGIPFKAFETGDPYDLPVITGITSEKIAEDREREIDRVRLALDLLRQYDRMAMSAAYPAQEVELKPDGGAVLTVGERGVTLELGAKPWRKKLLKAGRIVERLRANGQVPGLVFLDNEAHPERVVVRMR